MDRPARDEAAGDRGDDEDHPRRPACVQFRDQTVQVPSPRLNSNTKKCVLTMDGYSYVIVAGPPASDSSDDPSGNRDDPVFIDDNEGTIGSQDCDQNTRHGALTIVRRSSQKKNAYSEEYSVALSKEAESMLDEVDLSIEALPSLNTTEAIDKAALRLRCLLRHLRKGEISADVLHKNLFFAAKVLETAFGDEETNSDTKTISGEEQTETSKSSHGSNTSATATIRQKRLRAPIWARCL